MQLVLFLEIALFAAAFMALHRALSVREAAAAHLASEALDVTAKRILRSAPARQRGLGGIRPPC
ncbi:hypothetical protein [Pseudolabrys sp. FHR47]|uniref:hypothetical protein n=1 Tax=Pseudolabrys sp. FHR47 TaxID=2562284 RepID=UPI0010BE2837|nr:hypothetical protein [Pseudolabrys sp. FHR47]